MFIVKMFRKLYIKVAMLFRRKSILESAYEDDSVTEIIVVGNNVVTKKK